MSEITVPANTTERTITGKECRFAVHMPSRHPNTPDIHLIKEQVHYSDGTIEPKIKFLADYKRPVWITKPSYRNHKDKKEWEKEDRLLKTTCTQSALRNTVARLLDKQWSSESMRGLSSSPYLYGTDISSSALIKKEYMDRWPNLITPWSVATFDIETDVVDGTEEILMATMIFRNQVFTVVRRSFVQGFMDLESQILAKVDKYIGDLVKKFDLKIEIAVEETPYEVVKTCIGRAHVWMPDFLAIWNMDFDIPKVITAIEAAGHDPAEVFCDPSVPPDRRLFRYKQGKKKKVTASGKVQPINPSAQWHTLFCSCSFYVIDAMCAYRQIRTGQPEKASYSLDAILAEEKVGIQKLKFKEADQYQGLKWHQFMQTNYKLEYIVYNIVDCLAMLILDDEIKDLKFTLPAYAGVTDFNRFNSQPSRIADALHSFCLENGYVIGTLGEVKSYTDTLDEEDEEDEAGNLLSGWIITLPAHLNAENGLHCILEDPTIRTIIRAMVFDSDAVAAYPSATMVANVSKATTKREINGLIDVDDRLRRMQGINLTSGRVNALEYATLMFCLPKPFELLALYQAMK